MNKTTLILLAACLVAGGNGVLAQPHFQMVVPSQSYLGVQIRDITSTDVQELKLAREAGVYVVSVSPDSPAEKAGLREGDTIIQFSSLPVWSVSQFKRLVAETPPEREVELVVVRDGETIYPRATIKNSGTASGFGSLPGWGGERHPATPDAPRFGFSGEERPRSRARLGIKGQDLTVPMASAMGFPDQQGVLVVEVLADSPAEKGGLKAGDIITAVDSHAVATISDIANQLKAGSVEITVLRDKQDKTLTLDLTLEKEENPERLRL